MFWLLKMFFNRNRIRQLRAEWDEYHAEFKYIHALWVASIAMSFFYIDNDRFAMHREMIRRAHGRERYCNMLLRKMQENNAEYDRITS